jgi:protein-L-isoaspartate(D-aspartate) O-methyltransferase
MADEPDRMRREMVDQLVTDGLASDAAVRSAFLTVPRHPFVPNATLEEVYDPDRAIVTRVDAAGVPVSSSSAPNIMALMLDRLDLRPGARVLEIGTGTGYNAALLATITGPGGSVTSVDIDPVVAAVARERLDAGGFGSVRVIDGDGWLGEPAGAPYDRIEATVGIWDLSPHWLAQLEDGGVLVIPLWLRAGTEAVVAFERREDRLVSRGVDPCGFMRLRGPHAGPERYVPIGDWLAILETPTVQGDRDPPGEAPTDRTGTGTTAAASDRATHAAADRATHAAADRATHAAADRATHAATDRATHAATDRATHAAADRATDEAELLAGLLGLPATREPLGGELPEGWFARLAFEEPDSLMLVGAGDPGRLLQGLYDREGKSLALVGGGSVFVHGGPAALRRLRAKLPDLRRRPLDLRALLVDAVPAGTSSAAAGTVRFHRTSFDLVVTELDR